MNDFQTLGKIIMDMEEQMRSDLFKRDNSILEKKLWENTYIKHQIDRRKNGDVFSIDDHVRAMVYSMLSSGISWKRVENGIDVSTGKILPIDEIFYQYDIEQVLKCTPELLRDKVKDLHCASQYTLKQMHALLECNIPKLISINDEYGSIDAFYQSYIKNDTTLKTLIKELSDSKSKNKLVQMDVALVCEYLRNLGYDIPKPDRHIRRILGHDYLGCSDKEIVPVYDVFDIVASVAKEIDEPIAKVDYTLWSYCANGYGEICTVKNPQCHKCVAQKYCSNSNNYFRH